jgi:RNA polymerase sigma factor (sigma-70 family)
MIPCRTRAPAAPTPGAPLRDDELLARFVASGDEGAFADLVKRHGPLVMGVCRRVLGNVHDSEDAFQATFLMLARRAESIRQQSSLAPWLYKVAYHIALKAKAGRRKMRWEESAAWTADSSPLDPLTMAVARDVRKAIDDELDRLPKRYRTVIVLCHLQGMNRDEAAHSLGWSEGAVKGCLERARQILRYRLARRGLALATVLAVVGASQQAAAASITPALVSTTAAAGAQLAAAGGAGLVAPTVLALMQHGMGSMACSGLNKVILLVALLTGAGVTAAVGAWQAIAGSDAGQTPAVAADRQEHIPALPLAAVLANPEPAFVAPLVPKIRNDEDDDERDEVDGEDLDDDEDDDERDEVDGEDLDDDED